MSQSASEIILHNYPQSPVAEKVRVVLGIKHLPWRDVEIPRIPPKPLLIPLTGGYRRTPVMQIGADIYCDSQCIIAELERRYPTPTLMPSADAGLLWCLSRWTDGAMFDLAVKLVLGSAGDKLPAEFARDRGQLYLGPNWAEGLKAANAQLPHLAAQMRAPFAWINDQLNDGRAFLLGATPAAIDAQIYYVVWFLRGRWEGGGAALISEFPNLVQWEKRVREIGHGSPASMSAEQALDVAKAAAPIAETGVFGHDPQGLEPGMSVTVEPDVDGGEQPVLGRVRSATAASISVEREADDLGLICVHFPRTGYRITFA